MKSAYEIMMETHEGQTRKGSKRPYTDHCYDVREAVLEIDGESSGIPYAGGFGSVPPFVFYASLLHDALEDAPKKKKEAVRESIRKLGEDVLSLVDSLTATGEGKIKAIKKMKGNKWALMIKLADRYSNIKEENAFTEEYRGRASTIESTRLLLSYVTLHPCLTRTTAYKYLKDYVKAYSKKK